MVKLCIALATTMVCVLMASPMQSSPKIDDITDGKSYAIVTESYQIDNGNPLDMQKGFFEMLQPLTEAFQAAQKAVNEFLTGLK